VPTTAGNPLEQVSLDDLRSGSSLEWREHDPEVLPLWVAEMDVPLAGPVQQALQRAVAAGDTGYPAGTGCAEAVRRMGRAA
jgi:cystathionine beta-lyase